MVEDIYIEIGLEFLVDSFKYIPVMVAINLAVYFLASLLYLPLKISHNAVIRILKKSLTAVSATIAVLIYTGISTYLVAEILALALLGVADSIYIFCRSVDDKEQITDSLIEGGNVW